MDASRIRLPRGARIGKAGRMDELGITVRPARPDDAAGVARVYIDSWHDTYAGVLPTQLLCAMTPAGQSARWQATIRAQSREHVLVAEHETYGIVGMTSFGAARDGAAGFDSEVYTLYVDPNFFGQGAGKALLNAAFADLRRRGYSGCIIWAHAKNPARFFYEAMGGRLIASRTARLMGDGVPETAFGWRKLALAERASS
jgi:GNAT superfamily N-acetyltransferase